MFSAFHAYFLIIFCDSPTGIGFYRFWTNGKQINGWMVKQNSIKQNDRRGSFNSQLNVVEQRIMIQVRKTHLFISLFLGNDHTD